RARHRSGAVRVRHAERQSLQRLRCAWHLHNYGRRPTCGAGQVQCATGGLDAVDEPGDAGVPTGPVHACPALAVVGDDDLDAGLDRGDEDAGAGGSGVLGDVRQALGDDEVGHGFGLPPDPSLEPDVDVDGNGRPAGQGGDGGVESAVGEHGRVDATGELTQFGDDALGL